MEQTIPGILRLELSGSSNGATLTVEHGVIINGVPIWDDDIVRTEITDLDEVFDEDDCQMNH